MTPIDVVRTAMIEDLNPHFRWDRRKQKRRIKSLAKKLIPNVTHVMGCRGHPGLVVAKNYHDSDLFGADVDIKSLVDGVEESCSIYHCVPEIITAEEARYRAELMENNHSFDCGIILGWHDVETVRELWDLWVSENRMYYVLSDQYGSTVRSSAVMTKEDADKEISRLLRINLETNARMVDFRTYPKAPLLLGLP